MADADNKTTEATAEATTDATPAEKKCKKPVWPPAWLQRKKCCDAEKAEMCIGLNMNDRDERSVNEIVKVCALGCCAGWPRSCLCVICQCDHGQQSPRPALAA